MKRRPSKYFLGTILRGYDAEKRRGKPVTASAIWSQICYECIRQTAGFVTMFAWDSSKIKSINRIGTIQEVIKAGYVPGLKLAEDAKGRKVVVEVDK